jgi:predicted dienelactone hydrolase
MLVALALTAGATATAYAAETIGVREITIATHEPGRSLRTFVWYPATSGGTKVLLGDNPVFIGTEAYKDAPIESGKHPVIIVSHGSGGNAAGLGWLTTKLAAAGYIVAAPNHPGTTSGDSDPKRTVELWHRPADLSVTLDTLLADPAWATSIDPDKVGALGFSLGGYDVLALAGAEQRRKEFAAYCFSNAQATLGVCHWIEKGGVDLTALDPRFETNHRDDRFKTIVAVDPALTPSYDDASTSAIKLPVQFVNEGTPASTPGIVETHHLNQLIPSSRLDRVPDAVHFSFLGICKPNGVQILEEMGDDPICTDAGGRDRAALHADMIKSISGFLSETLPAR